MNGGLDLLFVPRTGKTVSWDRQDVWRSVASRGPPLAAVSSLGDEPGCEKVQMRPEDREQGPHIGLFSSHFLCLLRHVILRGHGSQLCLGVT